MLSLSANFCRRSHRWQCSHSKTESLAAWLIEFGCGCVAVWLGLETLRGGTVWVSTRTHEVYGYDIVCVWSLALLANAVFWRRQELKFKGNQHLAAAGIRYIIVNSSRSCTTMTKCAKGCQTNAVHHGSFRNFSQVPLRKSLYLSLAPTN